ncbi:MULTISPECIES: hypothetical protein [unclassified Erysipelothrix]|nr:MULTISPECIES: hypothetical protein [unclassified Erysipelothrix]MBK2402120.1 hypothetical protein [Erysipelothrix sp. strain 2 (EsS2-6-Brazil)]MBK2404540.1 hypothetical protein [Erysipelothrix sp. strain 2 (EsS2-7-Brazil)]NBA01156.1 hypothetical protein [Erysipelothrix rhusiopathiae]
MMKLEPGWLKKCENRSIHRTVEDYLNTYRSYIYLLPPYYIRKECISGLNRMCRQKNWSCESLNLSVSIGDICYMEFGQAFINEAGYQHFGLVMGIFNYKLFVVPMTSNYEIIQQARNINQLGKRHLYYIGQIPGLNKSSVLFLNDCKYVNSARVISINGRIDPNGPMFKEIRDLIIKETFGMEVSEDA